MAVITILRLFHARLYTIFSVFQPLKSNSEPEPIIFLFPARDQLFPVEAWVILALSADYLALSRTCRILRIDQYKARDGNRHEHLRVQVELNSPNEQSRRGWILVDCNPPSNGNDRPLSAVNLRTFPGAFDFVFIPKKGNQNIIPRVLVDDVDVVRKLTIPSNVSFSVADLAALLQQASELEGRHASAIYQSVRDEYQDCVETLGRAYTQRRKHLGLEIPCSLTPNDIETLREKWSERRKQVSEIMTMQEVRTSYR